MDTMKTALPVAALLVSWALAGPASAQMSSVQGDIASKGAINVTDTRLKPDSRPDDSQAEGEQLRLNGQCDKAVPLLRAYANRGDGYEISQFNLGMCLLDLAAAQHDAGQAAAGRKEGADWIVLAANAGLAKAQARAVLVYLDGTGVPADPVEAEKWSLLYHRNSTRIAIGLRDIAPQVNDRLDAELTDATRTQAEQRADNWVQKPQVSTADE
jgi:TPR repeat protein